MDAYNVVVLLGVVLLIADYILCCAFLLAAFMLGTERIRWDDWRGPVDGDESKAVMHIKHLWEWRGYKLDLHKMTGPDGLRCYHTHPGKAFRLILRVGYAEEVYQFGLPSKCLEWHPGHMGLVRAEYCHRIAWLLEACEPSYSLWFRWPTTTDVRLIGMGWPAHLRDTSTPERN